MNVVVWGHTPWDQPVPIHVAGIAPLVALAAALAFALGYLAWTRFRRPSASSSDPSGDMSSGPAAALPPGLPRHSLAARLFHWVMAAAVLALLATALGPMAGLRFAWFDLHVLAGAILIAAILFHLVQAGFFLDFRSIWPEAADFDRAAPAGARTAGRAGKYPLGNKLFHAAALLAVLTAAATGVLMLYRAGAVVTPPDPYILTEERWGLVYVLHGLAGSALVALVLVHVFFALLPEKRPLTMSMLTGKLDRDHYLAHHDPGRWNPVGTAPRGDGGAA